jgi:hypothetical protein
LSLRILLLRKIGWAGPTGPHWCEVVIDLNALAMRRVAIEVLS